MEIKNNKKGFTLIELIVYIGILSILIGIGADIFSFVIRAYRRAEMISSIELLGNNILTQIEQDARVSPDVSVQNDSKTVVLKNGTKTYTFVPCQSSLLNRGSVTNFNFNESQNFFGTPIYLKTLSSDVDFFTRTTDSESSQSYDMLTISFALSSGGSDPCTTPEYTSYFQTIVNLRGGISN